MMIATTRSALSAVQFLPLVLSFLLCSRPVVACVPSPIQHIFYDPYIRNVYTTSSTVNQQELLAEVSPPFDGILSNSIPYDKAVVTMKIDLSTGRMETTNQTLPEKVQPDYLSDPTFGYRLNVTGKTTGQFTKNNTVAAEFSFLAEPITYSYFVSPSLGYGYVFYKIETAGSTSSSSNKNDNNNVEGSNKNSNNRWLEIINLNTNGTANSNNNTRVNLSTLQTRYDSDPFYYFLESGFSNTADPYRRFSTGGMIYDDFQILQLDGDRCDGPAFAFYCYFTADSFISIHRPTWTGVAPYYNYSNDHDELVLQPTQRTMFRDFHELVGADDVEPHSVEGISDNDGEYNFWNVRQYFVQELPLITPLEEEQLVIQSVELDMQSILELFPTYVFDVSQAASDNTERIVHSIMMTTTTTLLLMSLMMMHG